MAKWKWFAVLPVLAALFVCAPILLSPSGSTRGEEGGTLSDGPITALPSPFEIGFALVVVLLLAVAGILVLRKLQHGRVPQDDSSIVIKETRRLSPKRSLHVLRAVDRLLLVGESEQGLSLICDLTPSDGAPTEFDAEPAEVEEDLEEEDGAVPRDLVLPARKPDAARRDRRAAAARGQGGKAKPAALADFRELLNRIG